MMTRAHTDRKQEENRRTKRMRTSASRSSTGWFVFAGVLAVAALCIGLSGFAMAANAFSRHYAGRIYPGVSVYGVDLSGLTVKKATAALQPTHLDPATLPLTLRDGERTWRRSWADLKINLDPEATAGMAYRVGRDGSLIHRYTVQLQALLIGWPLSPIVVLPDPAQATAALESLAPEVAVPARDAGLIIRPDSVTPVPAQAGLALDVEATVAALQHAVGVGPDGLVMELLTHPVTATILHPQPAQSQAQALLSQPFTMVADDPLTGFNTTWTVEPEVVANWLTTRPIDPAEDADSDHASADSERVSAANARLMLTIQEEPVRIFLESLAEELAAKPLPQGMLLDIEETLPVVQVAVETGHSQALLALAHPPRTYIVQPGDTLVSVARAHGFPVWRLTEANPDIQPGDLRPGQQIIIPSVDVLFPLPLIPDRRIVIDISDQRLRTYQGQTPIHDFVCSTGIASSPTLTGTFQILTKEEEAYASSWDLWMPHFMGIYRSGPDFTNGIHALPTLSSGARLWEGYLGRPVSYGCIVLGLDEAAALYEWTELGTLVVIKE